MSKRIIMFLISHFFQSVYMRNLDTYGVDWVVFNDEEGKPHYVDMNVSLSDVELMENSRRFNLEKQPHFWHYTRGRSPIHISMPPQGDLNIIPKSPLVVLVGGWLSTRDGNSTQLIKNAMLNTGKSINVIIMDWNDMQSYNYLLSVAYAVKAAKILKDFVLSISKMYQVDGSDIHLIGHSLGAHVVGLAGKKLKDNKIIVGRVTGLDPARPFFEVPALFPGISIYSAAFVDIIHTNTGFLGYRYPAGHADFYPGGGIYQPVFCPTWSILGTCEHSTSYRYFEKSFTNNFEARECKDYSSFKSGLCNDNDMQYMGYPCSSTARGTYYLDIEQISS